MSAASSWPSATFPIPRRSRDRSTWIRTDISSLTEERARISRACSTRVTFRTGYIAKRSRLLVQDAWPPSKRSGILKPKGIEPLHLVLLTLWAVALVVSAIDVYDPFTWVLEVFPAIIAVVVLAFTYRRFPLTNLLYVLIFVHSLILMAGGHYTYARVPLGFWMERTFHFTRNHYDRIGHFAQGFVPAIITREVLLRRSPLQRGKWLFFLVTCVCLAVSASYELIEWLAALLGGSSADAFLGTQGDVWDTQWDMFTALVGALSALVLLPRVHDRQLARLSAD